MLTYSINVGTVTESTNLADITEALGQLPDNTTKLISPRDVRDAVFTAWNNSIIKPTTISASTVEYIGLDSSENGINLKEKFFLGKRRLSGSDVMDDTLLNSDTDLYIFNNKEDSGSQDTKVSILSGTDSSLYPNAPYLESSYVIGATSTYLDLNVVNPTGDINIYSEDKEVSINGLIFPTMATNATVSNGYTLRVIQDSGKQYLVWEDFTTLNLDSLYSSGTVSIIGSPVLINGSPIEFTNLLPVPETIGGIEAGTTFSSVPIVNVLNDLLYPYIEPTVDFFITAISLSYPSSIYNNSSNDVYIEWNALSSIYYTYDINRYTTAITAILAYPGGSNNQPTLTRLSGTSSMFNPVVSSSFAIQVSDGINDPISTANVSFIYPFFWGVTTSNINFTSVGATSLLNKLVRPKSNITLTLSGDKSHIYFMCPTTYGNLAEIVDDSIGWNFISSFTKIHSAITITNLTPFWSGALYDVYSYTAGSGLTTVDSEWTFKY